MLTFGATTWRRALTGAAFAMAFLLTPRAWVEGGGSSSAAESVPIRALEESAAQECLWCEPPAERPCAPEAVEEQVVVRPDDIAAPCRAAPARAAGLDA